MHILLLLRPCVVWVFTDVASQDVGVQNTSQNPSAISAFGMSRLRYVCIYIYIYIYIYICLTTNPRRDRAEKCQNPGSHISLDMAHFQSGSFLIGLVSNWAQL